MKMKKRFSDVKTQKACKQGWEANIITKIKQITSIYPYISRSLYILLYSGVSTHVGLYGSGLFNFGYCVSLFACFLASLYFLSFLLKMFIIILVSFLFLIGVNTFCRLQKYWWDFSSSLPIGTYDRPFFSIPSYIESTTILSDKYYYYNMQRKMTVIMKMRSWSKVMRKTLTKGLLALLKYFEKIGLSYFFRYAIIFDEASNL